MPTQSGEKPTLQLLSRTLSSNMRSRSATGFRLILGFGFPLGRPRCEARISFARLRIAYSRVGSVSRILVSSVTRPSSESGTLKSTRTKRRLSLRERSLIESLCIVGSTLESFLRHEFDEIAHAARVSPLIVVPGDYFHAIAGNDASHERVHDRGTRVAAEVHRDQFLVGYTEYSFHCPALCGFESCVYLLRSRLLLCKGHQIHD